MKSPKENEAEGGREGGDIELAVGDSEHKGGGEIGAGARQWARGRLMGAGMMALDGVGHASGVAGARLGREGGSSTVCGR